MATQRSVTCVSQMLHDIEKDVRLCLLHSTTSKKTQACQLYRGIRANHRGLTPFKLKVESDESDNAGSSLIRPGHMYAAHEDVVRCKSPMLLSLVPHSQTLPIHHCPSMGSLTTPDFDAPGDKVLSPSELAHVVLRTANMQKMADFYLTFLGGTISHGNEMLCFITYDEEHHRIALIAMPGTGPKVPTSSGLHHIAFAFPTLSDLLLSYRQRKAKGILPVWSINHGPTTSIYYHDPDGNMLETQVDNFDTVQEATAFMQGKFFAENPIGADVDPEDLIKRIQNGEPDADLKRRVEIGPRGLPGA